LSSDNPRAGIAERVRTARKFAGLSQAQVASFLGLHRPAVTEIEAGRRRVTADEAGRLAEILDVDLAWLLGESSRESAEPDPRIGLAARELGKLRPEDLERLLTLIQSLRREPTE
jgi:transcriptional regulator with XRE-family HTH domain